MTTNIYQQIGERIIELLSEAEFNRLPPGTIREIQGNRYVLKNSRWHRVEPDVNEDKVKAVIKAAKTSDDLSGIEESLRRKIAKLEENYSDTANYEALLERVGAKYWKLRDKEDEAEEAAKLEKEKPYGITRRADGGMLLERKAQESATGGIKQPISADIKPRPDGRWDVSLSEVKTTFPEGSPNNARWVVRYEPMTHTVDTLPKLPKNPTQDQIAKFMDKLEPKKKSGKYEVSARVDVDRWNPDYQIPFTDEEYRRMRIKKPNLG